MKNFKNMLDESVFNSDIGRKLQSDSALRLSRMVIGSVMRNIDDYKKGKMDAEDFAKIISDHRKDLKDAAISIAKAKKK